jgi:paraquat-inducible protein B
MSGKYPEIPTISSTMDELRKNATEVLSEIRQIPFDKIGRQLLETIQGAKNVTTSPELAEALRTFNSTIGEIHAMTQADGVLSKSLKNIDTLTENLNTRVVKLDSSIEKTLRSIRTAMKTAAPNSPAAVNLTSALKELSAAARSMRGLTDYLNRHPEALLRGKGSKK